MTEWIVILGLTTVLCLGLSRFGLPRYRKTMQISAAVSALLCAGMLAGPPFDEIAGAIITVTIMALLLWGFLQSSV